MSKFRDKYRIKSNRWEYWDYKNPGAYFITICTKNKECFFGEIVNGEMLLNQIGSIAESEWKKTKIIRKDMNITLGEFVIMPDHIHGIIIIGNNEYNTTEMAAHPGRDAMHRVSTGGYLIMIHKKGLVHKEKTWHPLCVDINRL
ncbi:MAG: transposase [Gracilimonas sp.]|nr:transposase [Gracilimonas sp.]